MNDMGRKDDQEVARRTADARGVAQDKPLPRRLVLPNHVARVLDSNLSDAALGMGSPRTLVVLPCGAQVGVDLIQSRVFYRAPQEYSLASCPRITLDAVADAIGELRLAVRRLEKRLAVCEGVVLAHHGQGAFVASDEQRRSTLRREVHHEEGEGCGVDADDPDTQDPGSDVGSHIRRASLASGDVLSYYGIKGTHRKE